MDSLEGGECKQSGRRGWRGAAPSYSVCVSDRQFICVFQVGQSTDLCDNPFLCVCGYVEPLWPHQSYWTPVNAVHQQQHPSFKNLSWDYDVLITGASSDLAENRLNTTYWTWLNTRQIQLVDFFFTKVMPQSCFAKCEIAAKSLISLHLQSDVSFQKLYTWTFNGFTFHIMCNAHDKTSLKMAQAVHPFYKWMVHWIWTFTGYNLCL